MNATQWIESPGSATYLETVTKQLESCGAVRLDDASRLLTDYNYESSHSSKCRDAVEELYMPEDGSEGEYDGIEETGKLTRSQFIAVAERIGLTLGTVPGLAAPTGNLASDERYEPSESQYRNDTHFQARK